MNLKRIFDAEKSEADFLRESAIEGLEEDIDNLSDAVAEDIEGYEDFISGKIGLDELKELNQ